MAETKTEYLQLIEYKKQVMAELDKPRCIECEHQKDGRCHEFGRYIPEEYLYGSNDCAAYQTDIPF